MSVYIKGMRMPENCRKCPLLTGTFCDILNKYVDPFYEGAEKRDNNCPLVEIPEKHGKLIDADSLEPDADYDDGEYWAYSVAQVCSAQTIVEAEDNS